jgi:hypothetical protein
MFSSGFHRPIEIIAERINITGATYGTSQGCYSLARHCHSFGVINAYPAPPFCKATAFPLLKHSRSMSLS